MTVFGSIEEILDFAIAGESVAYQLYKELAKRAESEQMQKVLAEFAQEEQGSCQMRVLSPRHLWSGT